MDQEPPSRQKRSQDWDYLPTDLLRVLLRRLDRFSLRNARRVSRLWHQSANAATRHLVCNRNCFVPAATLVSLFPGLISLDLGCDWLSGTSLFEDVLFGLRELTALTRLEWLSLSGWSDLKDLAAALLPLIPSLTHLDLSCCTDLTDAGLCYVTELSNLKCLLLTGCSGVSGHGFGLLGKLSGLEKLALSETRVGNKSMMGMTGLRKLKVLEMMACEEVNDWGIKTLLQSMRNLVELNLKECSHILGWGLAVIWEENLRLKQLMLHGCDAVEPAYLDRLKTLDVKVDIGEMGSPQHSFPTFWSPSSSVDCGGAGYNSSDVDNGLGCNRPDFGVGYTPLDDFSTSSEEEPIDCPSGQEEHGLP